MLLQVLQGIMHALHVLIQDVSHPETLCHICHGREEGQSQIFQVALNHYIQGMKLSRNS